MYLKKHAQIFRVSLLRDLTYSSKLTSRHAPLAPPPHSTHRTTKSYITHRAATPPLFSECLQKSTSFKFPLVLEIPPPPLHSLSFLSISLSLCVVTPSLLFLSLTQVCK